MSAAASSLLAGLLSCFAAPPEAEADDAPAPATETETETDAESPDQPDQPSAPTEFEEQVDVTEDLPRDERYDPILPYGETPEQPDIEFAEETPPPPELDYADEAPPPPALDYDQSRQRPAPQDEALGRESDLADAPGEEEFQGLQASPQRFAVEIKFGPYLPDVDARYTGAGFGPYASIYGETDDLGVTTGQPRRGLYSVFSFEWQFYNIGGPLSLGTSIGYFRDRADALIAEPVGEGEPTRSTADSTVFHVVPVTLLLGYRFELLADRFRVPLVPYARGGVAHGFWLEKKGGEFVTNSAGQQSRGSSWGWQANLGLMLRLDFIERASAVDLDRLTGINHTYLFGEWQFSRLNNFGADTSMSIGDDTFLVGLAVEF